MNYLGHLSVGFVVMLVSLTLLGILGFVTISYESIFIYFGIWFIYSLLPDIDHKNSKITWLFIGIGIIGVLAGSAMKENYIVYSSVVLLLLTYLIAEFLPHRGPTHTYWFSLLLAVPLYFLFGWPEALVGFLCYSSHLVSDM